MIIVLSGLYFGEAKKPQATITFFKRENEGVPMEYTPEIQQMECVCRGPKNGPAPIPEEGKWVQAKKIEDISGFTHGVGWCAPQQGACKLTLNVKEGIIEEALIETIGCTGMTHSAAMACEIMTGKTILEAMNTDLVCDAINTAMRELFLQIVYGRTQSAFSEDGLPIGAGLEDLGKGLCSVTGTMYGTIEKGPRYLAMAEGHVMELALDADDEIIGYKYVKVGVMLEQIQKGTDPAKAFADAIGTYGRFDDAVKTINPRHQ
jgi:NifU-like protein involved in Fe-S cluster formation